MEIKRIHLINKGLLVVLYFLILFHQYIEVPFFKILFWLIVVFILIAAWRESSNFEKSIEKIPYDFRIQIINKKSKKETIIGVVLFLVIMISPYYIEFPFDEREGVDALFPFIIFFFFLVFLILFIQPQYGYYHFGKQVITGPGPDLKVIPWSEIRTVEIIEKEESFYLNLKRGSKIKFDLKYYYSDRKWEEVMNYLSERDLQIINRQFPKA